MDWFLYDNGLRHERVKNYYLLKINRLHDIYIFPKLYKSLRLVSIPYDRAKHVLEVFVTTCTNI